jgi:two-component system cell cycle sensor histidine kinase/response regulator CckA
VKRGQELQFANRELRALHAQLEQRVAERTEELARANAALQREVDARKSTAAVLEKTEAQLLHSQRLEAIGQLAGGIAHDFNNLLTAILGYEMLARDKVGEGSDLREELDGIRDAGQRAAELTKQLLTFSRRQVREVHVFELNDVVRRLRPMLQRLVGENIEFRLALTDASTAIEADRSQIEQVLMNLVVNARDAMPDGGTVTLHTDIVELDAAYTSQHLEVEPGEYAMLAVSDTGCGMDRATQERIFEPFFTTKEPGKGTGLGLSTVYGVVKVSRGSIWVYSEPGRGTVFKVYLPRSRRDASRLSESPSKPARAKPGERLLLVEDDPQVRTVAARMLGDAGYEVMPVDTADGALELARQPDVHFDALVTDVVMPRMGGRQLAELVQAIRPRVRVLFMSGYTDDVILQRGVLPSDSAFVPKPLTPASLSRKMRELLDRA